MITSSEPLPKGKTTILFDFAYDGGGPGTGGTGTLSINGKKVSEGRIAKTVPVTPPVAVQISEGELRERDRGVILRRRVPRHGLLP